MRRTNIAESNGNVLVVPDSRHHLFGVPILAQLASDGEPAVEARHQRPLVRQVPLGARCH
jgi:hypothetical protein